MAGSRDGAGKNACSVCGKFAVISQQYAPKVVECVFMVVSDEI